MPEQTGQMIWPELQTMTRQPKFFQIILKTLDLTYGDFEAMNLADKIQTLENFSVTVCKIDQRKGG